MFVKKKLIEKYNETYYRNYQGTDLKPMPMDVTSEQKVELAEIMSNMEHIQCYSLSQGTDNIYDLLRDVGAKLSGFKAQYSEFGKQLELNLQNVSYRATDIIFSKTKKQTDAFYAAVDLLKESENSALVGGCVRDSLIGKTPKDFDFATDIDYDRLEVIFKRAGFTVQEEGKAFLVMIVSKDGEQFEIANFRTDGMYEDGRRPESVQIGTIFDDGKRRDFTVNALYLNLTTKLLQDPNGTGIDDILTKTLRFVGKPVERLAEDRLRAYRFYRFLGRGFTADSKSLKAVRGQMIADNKQVKEVKDIFADDEVRSLLIKKGLVSDLVLTDFERIRVEIERMVGV